MTDNTTPAVSNENAVAAEAQPNFVLTRSYLKDLSLELPHAPQIFLENGDPATDMDLSVTYQMLDTGFYEVAVKVTVKTEINGKTLFLVEGTQGGIFRVDHIPLDQIEPLMRIMGAGIVYPYLRANIADAITRTGFPAVHLSEVNFQSFFEAQLAEEAANATKH